MAKRKSRVKRGSGADGAELPTRKEKNLVHRIARYWELVLPSDWRENLPFVKCFLDVFRFRRDNRPKDVYRRLHVAREHAWRGFGPMEIARKLDVDSRLGALFYAYGIANAPSSWSTQKRLPDDFLDEEPPPPLPLLDRIAVMQEAEEDLVWDEIRADLSETEEVE